MAKANFVNAQIHSEPCFYHHAIQAMEKEYPGYIDLAHRTFEEAKNNVNYSRSVAKIPVIVHIVWKNADENLPDSVVKDQIRILNTIYRRKNADTAKLRNIFKPIAADAMIEFELKEIRRTQTTKDFQASLLSLAGLDAVKQTAKGGDDAIDPDHFLNIWVCNIKPINILGSSSPLLGYAYPPANLSHWPANSAAPSKGLDGVVIWHKAFGGNKTLAMQGLGNVSIEGKTCVHEVGHYLGLRHIWGDGQLAILGSKDCNAEDGISDTPKPGLQSQFECDTTKNSCVDTPFDFPDMVENYMDYSSESCTNTFTKGQVAMMQSILNGPRKGLLESPLAAKTIGSSNVFDISPNPTTDYIYVKINNLDNIKNNNIQVFDNFGKLLISQSLSGENQTIDVQNLATGLYYLKINNQAKKFIKQ